MKGDLKIRIDVWLDGEFHKQHRFIVRKYAHGGDLRRQLEHRLEKIYPWKKDIYVHFYEGRVYYGYILINQP